LWSGSLNKGLNIQQRERDPLLNVTSGVKTGYLATKTVVVAEQPQQPQPVEVVVWVVVAEFRLWLGRGLGC